MASVMCDIDALLTKAEQNAPGPLTIDSHKRQSAISRVRREVRAWLVECGADEYATDNCGVFAAE